MWDDQLNWPHTAHSSNPVPVILVDEKSRGSKLREGGWLLLGHSESLLNVTADFEIVHLTRDLVYRKPLRAAGGTL